MSNGPVSRRAVLGAAVGVAGMAALPAFAQDNSTEFSEPATSVRNNISSFRMLQWQDYFDNTRNGAILADTTASSALRVLAAVTVLLASGRAGAAQQCHPLAGNVWRNPGLMTGVRLDAAGYRNTSYLGDYQGLAPTLGFNHPKIAAMLLLPASVTLAEARDALRMLAQAMPGETGTEIVLDASGLLRFDSSALAVLLECRRLALAFGRPFGVRNAPEKLSALAALYVHFARYLMIASSRPGSEAANLQGRWIKIRHFRPTSM